MTPTPHGQVPEALIDLIDAYAETRHRCGGIYNAKTEAARNAVIEALSGVQALSAAPAEQQAAPKAAPGDAIDEAMRERDDAEDFIDALLDEVLGHERPEWSNLYGRADALNDVQERMTSLHKPAVDKAWGQFQSAMAAPQQEAHHLTQALTDPENQPNQYGVEFGMSGQQMHFKIGNQLFRLAYEPDDQEEFEFMKRMLINAFSTFTPDVKTAPQQGAQEPCPTCAALARTVMLDQVSFDRKPDCYGIRQITDDDGVEEWEDTRTSPDVAREEANDMMATGRGEIYEVVPLWTTPQPAPAPLSDDVVKDAAFEAVRKKLCALPRYSFVLDDDGLVRRAPDRTGNWIEFDEAHALFDPVSVDAAIAAQLA